MHFEKERLVELRRKAVSGIVLTMLLASIMALAFDIQQVKATGTIYIRADGSVDPATAPITNFRNMYYTFTDNVYDPIIIERDNIVVDGAGHAVQGTGTGLTKGMDLSYRSNITIRNLSISRFGRGIYFWYSSNISIYRNNITENYYGGGIGGYSIGYVTIYENNIVNNDNGVYLYDPYGGSHDNNVFSNNITANEHFGVWFDYISNNSLFGNNITSNKGYGGIRLRGSSNNSIYDNSVVNNEYGIYFWECQNNIIYHNNFVENKQQLYDGAWYYPNIGTSRNTWDDGYPSGGNYWSHYTDVDLHSGPYQNETGSDDIGDTPYVIDENNQDRYPLMEPWTPTQPQLKAPWVGIVRITQGNNGATSHHDYGTWDNTYAIDVALSVGSDVPAPADGIVKYVDNDPSGAAGKELALEHTGPTGKKFVTVYLHLNDILVEEGNFVKQGQIVAKSGDTGIVTGPHLHFHMWRPKGIEPEWAYDSHTMPIERLVMKQIGVDSDFREYNARKGELDDDVVAGKLFESNNIPPSPNKPPVADVGQDQSVSSGDFVMFNGSNSYDLDGTILRYQWDFGDGTTAEGKVISHRFRGAQNEPKIYTITLTVEDNDGATDTDTVYVSVAPLEKTVEVSDPPILARMTVTYNWIEESGGEDIYIISKIHVKAEGFVGIFVPTIFVWEYQYPLGELPSIDFLDYLFAKVVKTEKTYTPPFSTKPIIGISPPIARRTFAEGTFEGIQVKGTDIMSIYAQGFKLKLGWPPIDVELFEFSSVAFEPDAPPPEPSILQKLLDKLLDELPDLIIGQLGSPGELKVYDSEGRITGFMNGEIKEEIPNSAYFNNTVMLLSEGDSYRYEVAGKGDGSYGLMVASFKKGNSTTFTATDIPTSTNAIHQYSINWTALATGSDGTTIYVDSDGDGTFEKTFTANSELIRDEFLKHFPPIEAFPMWIVGVAVVAVAMSTVAIAFFWRKRKHPPTKG